MSPNYGTHMWSTQCNHVCIRTVRATPYYVIDDQQGRVYSGSTSKRSIGKEGGLTVNRRVML